MAIWTTLMRILDCKIYSYPTQGNGDSRTTVMNEENLKVRECKERNDVVLLSKK
jgi:hypothetical protein